MEFLNPKEQTQLQKTLSNSELLKDAGLRGDLLTNCGLRQCIDLLPLDRPTRSFAISLCAKLSGVYVTVDGLPKLALVIFLEHISDIDNSLSAEDVGFIKHVINKWERSQPSPKPNFSTSPEQGIILQTFEFDVAAGENQLRREQAQYFCEDLGYGAKLEMVAIPSGSFLMGSPDTEAGHFEEESPQHWVRIDPFFIGKYPVTQIQWQAVAALPQVNRALDPNISYFKGANRPVEDISWYDAVEFCDRLSQKTGHRYRLPSEAEWEYACRAGTSTPFHFGETITPKLANYNSERKGTTDVGSFRVANAFGLYDMHGNVWEWCADHWHDSYNGSPGNGSPWLSDNDNQKRVLRGGSWLNLPRLCRSAYRDRIDADHWSCGIGFRVACAAARTS